MIWIQTRSRSGIKPGCNSKTNDFFNLVCESWVLSNHKAAGSACACFLEVRNTLFGGLQYHALRRGYLRTAILRGLGVFWTTWCSTCCNWIRCSLSLVVWPCSLFHRLPLFWSLFRYVSSAGAAYLISSIIEVCCILRVTVVLGAPLRSSFINSQRL